MRLSQQLQIELEKIRQSEIEVCVPFAYKLDNLFSIFSKNTLVNFLINNYLKVRWQEPDDVHQCNNCNRLLNPLHSKTRKVMSMHALIVDIVARFSSKFFNCFMFKRHFCIQIFCSECLNHKVLSGPTK